jgi:hypothetical protein
VPTPFGDAENFRRFIEQIQKSMKPAQDALEQMRRLSVTPAAIKQANDLARRASELVTPDAFLQANRIAQQLSEQFTFPQKQLLEMARAAADLARLRIDPKRVRAWVQQGLPPNWGELKSADRATELHELMRRTGFCLVWVPRWDIVLEVADAVDDAEREEILLKSAPQIFEDIRATLDEVSRGELTEEKVLANKALAAYDEHPEGAQALAAAAISSVIGSSYEMKFAQARTAFGRDALEQPWLDFRQWTVLELVAGSLQQYFPEKGDPIPTTFSRHASAHSASAIQFTRINALAALLLLAAFLRETQELLEANDEGDVD